MLEEPFLKNEKIAMTGPLQLYDRDVSSNFLVFCLVMIKHDMFYKLGLLDEIFSPGYGEDIDFAMKIKQHGYEFAEVGRNINAAGESASYFPFWHKSTQTFGSIPEYGNVIVPRNQQILRERYKK